MLIVVLLPYLAIILGVVPICFYLKDRDYKTRPLFVILEVALRSRYRNTKRYILYVLFCNGSDKELTEENIRNFPTITFPPECRIISCRKSKRSLKMCNFDSELIEQRIELQFKYLKPGDATLISIEYEADASSHHFPEFLADFKDMKSAEILNWKDMNKLHDYGSVCLFLVAGVIPLWLILSAFSVAAGLAYILASLLSLCAFALFFFDLLKYHTEAIPTAAKEFLAGKGSSHIRPRINRGWSFRR